MINRISRFINQGILHWKPVASVIRWSRRIVFPGFDRMPLYDVAVFFFKGLTEGYLTSRASAISFNFFLAIFPMIIAFFTLIPFVPVADFQSELIRLISDVTPDSTQGFIDKTILDIIERPRGGLLSFTFILAIYFAANGFDSIIEAFNNTYHTIESRTWVKQKLISILLFFIVTFIVILAIVLLTTGSLILDYLMKIHLIKSWMNYFLLNMARWVILTGMIFFTISFIYYLAPARASQFRFISAGSTLATILSLAASIGFNFYVQNFSSYNALYGSIGTLLIILVWIYFNAFILLIGFELNASIQSARIDKDGRKGENKEKITFC